MGYIPTGALCIFEAEGYNTSMKLYLSSYHLGDDPTKLAPLFSENKRVAVIMNACDYKNKKEREEKLSYELRELAQIGLQPEELDLRNYFNREKNIYEKLRSFGGVWVRGGNVFILRRAMKQSGFDKAITEISKDASFVYAGFSAGPCVISPTLRGYAQVDDPHLVPEGYEKEIIWDGLNFIPYVFEPHYKSDHPEAAMVEKEVEYLEKNGIPYKTVRDGEVIISET